jgi:hypothetical protein
VQLPSLVHVKQETGHIKEHIPLARLYPLSQVMQLEELHEEQCVVHEMHLPLEI